mmetsp:Transcript_32855/g.37263  ORF Transcript_32855/g.37263 Transcript_32855/m.37263 type:complete len:112 (+) Transcript_32855:235-570(+)
MDSKSVLIHHPNEGTWTDHKVVSHSFPIDHLQTPGLYSKTEFESVTSISEPFFTIYQPDDSELLHDYVKSSDFHAFVNAKILPLPDAYLQLDNDSLTNGCNCLQRDDQSTS